MIDADGYRPNVGIILSNPSGQLFWARRIGQDAWQFPQGGIKVDETPEQALFRELWEEIGLAPEHEIPVNRQKNRNELPLCIGQKQIWYLLRLASSDKHVKLDLADKPEFDGWRWVDYWYPLKQVVAFKRDVYERALHELAPLLNDPVRCELEN